MNRIVQFTRGVLARLATVSLAALALGITLDVVMRFALNMPIRGGFEIAEILLVVIIFTGFPLVSIHDEHIAIGILADNLGPRTRRLLITLAHIVTVCALAGVAWIMVARTMRLHNDGMSSPVLQIPYWPVMAYMVCMLALAALMQAVHAFRAIRRSPQAENVETQEFGL